MSDINDPIEVVRRRLTKALKGFTTDFPEDFDPWTMSGGRPDREQFPVPELVLFMLRNLMGWRWQGHGEKVRWTVYGSIAGEPVGFELRKFGFTILRIANAKIPTDRIIGQLHSGLKEVEKLLGPYANGQIELGEVLIVNHFTEFGGRYTFFRTLADKAYKKAKRKPRRKRTASDRSGAISNAAPSFLSDIVEGMNREHRAKSEGFFYSTAMIDAYFSSLEHRLVLLRAFTGRPLAAGDLRKMLSAKWEEKLKIILPGKKTRSTELLLASMRRIKERIRNPFAHGGFENDGGSLLFHLPNVGVIPANLSKFGDSVRFSFMPIGPTDYAECCTVFDEIDKMLSTGELTGAHRLLEAGIDPVFNEEHIKEYAEAIAGGDETLEAFIEGWHHQSDQHANMDY